MREAINEHVRLAKKLKQPLEDYVQSARYRHMQEIGNFAEELGRNSQSQFA